MKEYVTSMIEGFSKDLLKKGNIVSPFTDSLFKVDDTSKILDKSHVQYQSCTGSVLI